jgi:GNAT superfamily N-acetyltransferase
VIAKADRAGKIEIRALAPSRVEDLKTITRGTFGTHCYDLFWRLSKAQRRATSSEGTSKDESDRRRREVIAKLARRRYAPLLIAYIGGEPAGFASLGPRSDYPEMERLKSTPAVDEVPVWIIPCITVRPDHRRRGVARALLRASMEYARKSGAPAIEGYPRPDGKRIDDRSVFMGTESLFRSAGFRKIRDVVPALPRLFTPRVTMRAAFAPARRTNPSSKSRKAAV